MKITQDDITHLAALSRLSAQRGAEKKTAGDLTQILSYVEKLQEVKESAVLARDAKSASEMREDAVVACPQSERMGILRNTPKRAGDLIATPAIF